MKNKNAIPGRLTWKDFNVFSRTNPLNRVESKEGTLTLFALDEAARGTTYIIRWASDRWTTKALV